MQILSEDFWKFFWILLKYLFKIIFWVSPILIWYVLYMSYLEADKAEKILMMYMAGALGISVIICFLRHHNDTSSGFVDLYKNCFIPINIFTDIMYIVLMFYKAISAGETINFELAISIILPTLLMVFLMSFAITLITVCLIILYQAFTKGYKLYKEIKGMVTDKGVQTFFKIIGSIIVNGFDLTKKKIANTKS